MTVIKSYFSLFHNNVIKEFSAIAPSPQRDFHQFLITTSKFIWRWWKITARNDGAKFHPGEIIDSYEDFMQDERLHSEIRRIFDKDTLQYALRIAQGCYDILPRLPRKILSHVFYYLNLEDIVNLGYTSKALYRTCNDEALWQELYHRYNHSSSPTSVADLAETFGWKRLFFTNKLQLQMQLRRLKNNRSADIGQSGAVEDDETLAETELPLDHIRTDRPPTSANQHISGHVVDALLLGETAPPRNRYATSTIAAADDWNDLESEFQEKSFFEDTEEEELRNLKDD